MCACACVRCRHFPLSRAQLDQMRPAVPIRRHQMISPAQTGGLLGNTDARVIVCVCVRACVSDGVKQISSHTQPPTQPVHLILGLKEVSSVNTHTHTHTHTNTYTDRQTDERTHITHTHTHRQIDAHMYAHNTHNKPMQTQPDTHLP